MSWSKDFQKNLIKGKITEEIFHQMFIEDGKYVVIPFGYEKVLPELVRFKDKSLLESIKDSPDFVLAYKQESIEDILLVEVKFRHKMVASENLKMVIEQNKRWSPSCLFIATAGGFYFGKCKDIIKNKGMIDPLTEKMVSRIIQDKYKKILKDFLK